MQAKVRRFFILIALVASVVPGLLIVVAKIPGHTTKVSTPTFINTTYSPAQLDLIRLVGQQKCAQPPKNFNPIKATDAEISYYGFPRRPSVQAGLSDWLKAVSGKIHRQCFSQKPLKYPFRSHPQSQPFPQHGKVTYQAKSGNWAGWYVPLTSSVKGAQGYFNDTCPFNENSTTRWADWVGLGGFYSGEDLWQGGWDPYSQLFWYEQVAGPHTGHSSFGPYTLSGGGYCGSVGYMRVDYHYTVSTGPYIYGGIGPVYGSIGYSDDPLVMNSAEWIDERPLLGTCFAQLADFVKTNWTGGEWSSNGSTYLYISSSSSNSPIDMWDNSGHELAAPGSLNGSNFTDNYIQQAWSNHC
jgi:hypothetical protein